MNFLESCEYVMYYTANKQFKMHNRTHDQSETKQIWLDSTNLPTTLFSKFIGYYSQCQSIQNLSQKDKDK